MIRTRLLAALLLLVAAPALTACGPLGALRTAAEPLQAFTLQPAAFQPGTTATGRHLFVDTPATSGAIDTDRILVKPSPVQVQYLPGARWIDTAPELVQSLLMETLQKTNAFRFVARTTAGPMPDYTLLTEIIDFQAEATRDPELPIVVRVTFSVALVREEDRAIISSRQVSATRSVPSADTFAIVAAFDAATDEALAETTSWLLSLFGIRPS